MIPRQAVHQHRSFGKDVGIELCVAKCSLRAREGGLQPAKIAHTMFSAGLFNQSIVKKQDLLGTEVDHRFARVSKAGRYRSMKASTCVAKACFTLRRMTADSEEEPFFCLRIADLLTLRMLPFIGAMIPQPPCEHNAR